MPIHDTPLSLRTISTVLYALEAAHRMDDYPPSSLSLWVMGMDGWSLWVCVRCVVLCFDGYLIVRGSVRLLKVDIILSSIPWSSLLFFCFVLFCSVLFSCSSSTLSISSLNRIDNFISLLISHLSNLVLFGVTHTVCLLTSGQRSTCR